VNDFVWKGKDPEGRERCERVTAENAQAAKAELLAQGWTDLHLVMDEICDFAGRGVEGPPPDAEGDDEFQFTVDEEEELLAACRGMLARVR